MPALDDRSNFVYATVVGGYDAAQTSIQIDPVMWARLPSPVVAGFNMTWWNRTGFPSHAEDPDAEIVRVTGTTFPDLITVVRGQEGRPASAKNLAGKTYRMILGTTKKMIDDIEGLVNSVEASVNSVEASVISLEASVDSLEASVISVEASVDSLEASVISVEALANSKSTDYFWRFKAFPASVVANNPLIDNGLQIAYGDGVHIAVGFLRTSAGGPFAYARSTDGGETWAALLAPAVLVSGIHKVAFGAGVFIGINTTITASHLPAVRSTDGGLTFTQVTLPIPAGSNAQGEIFYAGDRFLIFMLNGQVLSSVDAGVSWVVGTMPLPSGVQSGHLWRGVAFGGGVYLAIAQVIGTNNFARSTDGGAWAIVPAPNVDIPMGIIHADSRFIINISPNVSTTPMRFLLQTTDGLAYTRHSTAFSASHGKIAKVNDIYVTCSIVAGQSGQISRGGDLWKRQDGATPYNVTRIVASPNRLIATVDGAPIVVGVPFPLGVLIMDVPP